MLNFTYRRQYFQRALLGRDLSDQAGVIIYVDLDPNKVATYMPIRLVRVIRHSPFRGAAERERLAITFRLGDFVSYPERGQDYHRYWHTRLEPFDTDRMVDGRLEYFVIPAGFEPATSKRATAWEDLVAAVGRSNQLRNAIFVKVGLRNLESAGAPPLKTVGEQQVYQMRPGTVYALDLSVYKNLPAGGGPAAEARITLSRSSELLEVGQPFQSVVSGLAEQTALISCKRTVEKNLVALGVAVEEPVANVVNTPHPFFLLRISLPWQDFALILVFVFLGSFLVALDKDSVHEVGLLASRASFFAVVAKWLGAGCLAFAGFLGLRKLPSGAG
jgi:hypothetical protein